MGLANTAVTLEQHYTYEDYIKWDDENRWELIDGVPYMMSAPNREHQAISMSLGSTFHQFLKGKSCSVYAAPFDVRLNPDKGNDTVVQPDLLVVCNPSKLDKAGAKGAPDLIVEIISPSSVKMDRLRKYNKYQQVGVKEYWVINPANRTVDVNILQDNGTYLLSNIYTAEETIEVKTLEGLTIHLNEIFEPDPEATE